MTLNCGTAWGLDASFMNWTACAEVERAVAGDFDPGRVAGPIVVKGLGCWAYFRHRWC